MSIKKTKVTIKHEESKMQQSCVAWFRMQHRKHTMLLFAVPNGSKLSGSQKQRAITGKRLKSEGVVAGVADLILMIPSGDYSGLCLEAKTATGRQSDSQKDFEKAVLSVGYGYALFRSLKGFQEIIKSYLENGVY